MPIRITGLNSGLDTESIISALVSSYSYKTDKYKKAQTKLSWKQDAWKTLNAKIYSLYQNVGKMRTSDAYNLKKVTVSDSTKVTVKAGKGAVNGTYGIQVTSLAKAGYLTGAQLDKDTKGTTKLSELGYTGTSGKISVNVGGVNTDVEVSKDSTVSDVVNQLKDAGVSASYDEVNHRFYVSSKKTGVENDFVLTGGDASGTAALTALGLNVKSDSNIAEYQDLAKYSNLTKDDIKALAAEKQTATDDNIELNKQNVFRHNAIAFANASAAINAVGAGKNADDFTLLKTLASQSNDLKNKYVDADGNLYTYDSDTGKYNSTKVLTGGTYDETTQTYTDKDGNTHSGGTYIPGAGDYVITKEVDDTTGLTDASDKYKALARDFGLVVDKVDKDGKTVEDSEALDVFRNNLSTVVTIAQMTETNGPDQQKLIAEANEALANGTVDQYVTDLKDQIEANETTIKTNDGILAANSRITAGITEDQITALMDKAAYAQQIVDGTITPTYNTGANRIDGADATIYVNGVEYTGTSNDFSINGVTISATGVTGTVYDATEASAVTATVNTDTQGIYDKVKDFLTQYNSVINEMSSLYNASSAKGYEPLTSEEKDAMSDTEVELWEEKIKSSLLRRDDTLDSLISSMTTAMSQSVKIGDKSYTLASFGIKTLGYFNAGDNQHNAYHIDGDADDSAVEGKDDLLMAAITNDPDTVLEFMKGLTTNLYKAVDAKMRSTSMSSIYTVYNDKEMASEYSDYTTTIKKWEEKLKKQEDYYYKKFSAMETALSKLNSQSSSLSGLLG